jgi:hypothetical protein
MSPKPLIDSSLGRAQNEAAKGTSAWPWDAAFTEEDKRKYGDIDFGALNSKKGGLKAWAYTRRHFRST